MFCSLGPNNASIYAPLCLYTGFSCHIVNHDIGPIFGARKQIFCHIVRMNSSLNGDLGCWLDYSTGVQIIASPYLDLHWVDLNMKKLVGSFAKAW